MLAKRLGWLAVALSAALAFWAWRDPVGFSQNPVITWFKGLSVPLPERLR
jgi:hypothetical protein